jgi:hypothetical protein
MKKANLGMKQMPRVWKVCMMVWNKWQMFWNKHTFEGCPHCTTNGFFQDGICVVWVCFVPFRTVFVWCGFVLYHCGLVSCFFVFVVYNLKHTGHFSQPKWVKICIVCHWLHTTNGRVLYHWNFFIPAGGSICVVWVCFAVHFSQPKMSQNLYCVPLVAHHEWESFVPMKFFLYQLVQKKFH